MNDQTQKAMFPVEGRAIGFAEKEFKTGTNYTVRLGENWAKKRDLKVGDVVSITSQDRQEFFFSAKITHIMKCDLGNVPKEVISKNHQVDMRDGIGLVCGLQGYYDTQLTREDRVVCVGFEPVMKGGSNA